MSPWHEALVAPNLVLLQGEERLVGRRGVERSGVRRLRWFLRLFGAWSVQVLCLGATMTL